MRKHAVKSPFEELEEAFASLGSRTKRWADHTPLVYIVIGLVGMSLFLGGVWSMLNASCGSTGPLAAGFGAILLLIASLLVSVFTSRST